MNLIEAFAVNSFGNKTRFSPPPKKKKHFGIKRRDAHQKQGILPLFQCDLSATKYGELLLQNSFCAFVSVNFGNVEALELSMQLAKWSLGQTGGL